MCTYIRTQVSINSSSPTVVQLWSSGPWIWTGAMGVIEDVPEQQVLDEEAYRGARRAQLCQWGRVRSPPLCRGEAQSHLHAMMAFAVLPVQVMTNNSIRATSRITSVTRARRSSRSRQAGPRSRRSSRMLSRRWPASSAPPPGTSLRTSATAHPPSVGRLFPSFPRDHLLRDATTS